MKVSLNLADNLIGKIWFRENPILDRWHRHDELECNLIVQGSGAYLVNGQRLPFEQHSVLWLFPDQTHLMLDQSPDLKIWILVVTREFLEMDCKTPETETLLARDPAGSFSRRLGRGQMDRLLTLCREINQISPSHSLSHYNAGIRYLLLSIWTSFLAEADGIRSGKAHPAIEQIVNYLYSGSGPDDLESLAAYVDMRAETVSRLFKAQTGIGLAAFRNRCRLERFLDLYKNGYQMTLLDAALAAGFGSYAQFYRVFCDMMGESPREFRRQRRS